IVALVAILDLEHQRTELVPTARLLPQLRRLDRRHQELDRPAAIHFFTHNGLDFAQDPEPQGHPRVEAAPQAPDKAGSEHVFMAYNLGLSGRFLEGGDEKLRNAHRLPDVEKRSF